MDNALLVLLISSEILGICVFILAYLFTRYGLVRLFGFGGFFMALSLGVVALSSMSLWNALGF